MYQIPEQATELIRDVEGCKLRAYLDICGNPTIGIGHKMLPHEPLSVTITLLKAEELLDADLQTAAACITQLVTAPLNDHQFSALLSFVFNVGVGNFANSTLLKRLNRKDYNGAAAQFTVWNKGTIQGMRRVIPALTERRIRERDLFTKPVLVTVEV